MKHPFTRAYAIFFPSAGLLAALQLGIWIQSLSGGPQPPAAFDPLALHIHEMIFGFLSAIVTGFLLTAVPNWTGRLPVRGVRLALLFGLWLAGRLVLLFGAPAPLLAAAVDSLFLVVLALMILREILAGKNLRNLPVCLLISLLALANIGWHAAVYRGVDAALYERGALAVIALLIALIGGRITPSFTRNWLVKQGESERLPAPFSRLDKAALLFVLLGLAAWTAMPESRVAGILLLLGGAATFLRLARWSGLRTLSEPLLAVLHLAYGLLALAFLLLGVAALWPQTLPPQVALHGLTTGPIGLMTLAVMTRAILGHSGRTLRADGVTKIIFLLAILGAILRLSATWSGTAEMSLLGLAALSWGGAFALFAVWYVKILMTPPRPTG